jgi:glutamyl-tRNA reductase
MGLLLIGLNHRTAPVDVREQLAFSRDGAATALMLFHSHFPDAECTILSTCNRVELLVNSERDEVTANDVIGFLAQARDVAVTAFKPHLYILEGRQVIRHMFRVISGLDSMVVGEYQIVNQLKQAYQMAHEQQTAGAVLHRLFHHAFGVSKRLRTETYVGEGKVSIPSVAVEMVRQAVPDFASKRILMVGAGEMAQLTAQYLRDADAREFVVTTRTLTNARALAEACNGEAVPFAELDEQLVRADIVVTATACPSAILTVQRVRRAQERRNGRTLFLLDLAVPRNIEAEVGQLGGVRLHDVDGLGRIVDDNQRQRQREVEACEQIIEDEVDALEHWLAQSRIRPLIEQMYEDVRELAAIEVRATFRRCPDLSEAQKEAVEQLADRLVAKLMHPCVSTVRREALSESATHLAAAFHSTRMDFEQRNERLVSRMDRDAVCNS